MRLLNLVVQNFRGIKELTWSPPAEQAIHCLVGPCDARKTTVLEAVELVLSDRWAPPLTDADFYEGDLSAPIVIEATVGNLPASLEAEDGLGHWIRGWDREKREFVDDPEDTHDFVLTIRVEVDRSLEAVWCVVKPGAEDRRISGDQRAALGASWLGNDPERHLTWARGSALWRTTQRTAKSKLLLADALRAARTAVASSAELGEFATAAQEVQKMAMTLGVRTTSGYAPGLDLRSSKMGSGMLSLHDATVSALQAGMGTRRLLALAVQRLAVPTGAILLVDEIEHGLEPHRLRRLVATLRGESTLEGPATAHAVGHALITTHSPVAIVELKAPELQVVREDRGKISIGAVPQQLQDVVRRAAEAFLARKVIVCEGRLEIGLCRALEKVWAKRHADMPLAHQGVALVDGGGHSAPTVAQSFQGLGYATALFMDHDDTAVDASVVAARAAGVRVARWTDPVCTEERLATDIPLAMLDKVVTWATNAWGEQPILDAVRGKLGVPALVGRIPSEWIGGGANEQQVRRAVGAASKSHKHGWYKQIEAAEQIGAFVVEALPTIATSDLAIRLAELEAWIYEP